MVCVIICTMHTVQNGCALICLHYSGAASIHLVFSGMKPCKIQIRMLKHYGDACTGEQIMFELEDAFKYCSVKMQKFLTPFGDWDFRSYSPDIAFSDHHVLGPLKDTLRRWMFGSDDEVKEVVHSWLKIYSDMLMKLMQWCKKSALKSRISWKSNLIIYLKIFNLLLLFRTPHTIILTISAWVIYFYCLICRKSHYFSGPDCDKQQTMWQCPCFFKVILSCVIFNLRVKLNSA